MVNMVEYISQNPPVRRYMKMKKNFTVKQLKGRLRWLEQVFLDK